MTENEKILSAWIARNSHFCPFENEPGFSLQGCTGHGSDHCPECIVEHARCLDPHLPATDKYGNDMRKLKPGDHVLYQNGSRFEIGRVKSVDKASRTAFVFYSLGETASRTSFSDLIILHNAHTVVQTALGGDRAKHMFDEPGSREWT